MPLSDFKIGQRVGDADMAGTVTALDPHCVIYTSRGVVVEPTVTVEWDDGEVTGERPDDLA